MYTSINPSFTKESGGGGGGGLRGSKSHGRVCNYVVMYSSVAVAKLYAYVREEWLFK